MPRPRNPAPADLAQRLASVKLMVVGMKDAMPRLASDLRREACESLDDIIMEVRRL